MAVGTRTGSEAAMRAISVLGNVKSNCHRKTHRVEPDGTGRKFTHLNRGDLWRESTGEVSRCRSSEDAWGNLGRAKGRRSQGRMKKRTSRVVGRDGRASSKTRFPSSNAEFGVRWIPRPYTSRVRQDAFTLTGQNFSVLQPPDAENRTSGGVECSRCAIPVSPSDLFDPFRAYFVRVPARSAAERAFLRVKPRATYA
jgi:hypothetical protein